MEAVIQQKRRFKKKIILLSISFIVILASIATYYLFGSYNYYQTKEVILEDGEATFVLIPGAGHGAWSYDRVKSILQDNGQTTYALTLPGLAERADELNSNIDLHTHIEDVVKFLEENNLTDVILVGHSYAGMVITGVADRVPSRIKHIVYLDAVHPSDGQNLLEAQPLTKYVDAVNKPLTINDIKVNLYPDEETIKFLGLKEKEDIKLAKQHLTPHPWKTFTQRLKLKNPNIVQKIGKTDIYTQQQMIGLLLFRQIDREEKENAWVIKTGHDLMITEYETVANMLLNVASKLDK